MPDRQGYLLPNERRILLSRFAPVLVLFPETPQQAPYPDEGDAIYAMRGSYHPRAVEFFLENARVRYRSSFLLRHPARIFRPLSYFEERRDVERSIDERAVERALGDLERTAGADPRYAGLGEQEIRAEIRKRLVQERLAERIEGFDLPLFRGQNIEQWRAYYRFLASAGPQARRCAVYGRVVQGNAPLGVAATSAQALLQQGPGYGPFDVSQARIALQYWLQYYYNDWANRHEGDWEGITILLELDPDVMRQPRELDEDELLAGVRVHDVGYAVHEDGYRRLWEDVQRTAEGRPIVYVARGSSASYFAWDLEGYPASARVGAIEKASVIPGKLLRGRRIFGRRWDVRYSARFTGLDPKNTDWVAADPQPHDRAGNRRSNLVERLVPNPCRGVRRVPARGPAAGLDDATYHLETDDLFWLEMVHEYGVQWGENSWLPGAKGPGGMRRTSRDKTRREIYQLARLENLIERALDALSTVRFSTEHALPELNPVLRRLRPRSLRREKCFPRSVQLHVYTMWAWILKEHPEAWPYGPGLRLSLIFRGILYPGILRFIRKAPEPEPLVKRSDPMYHLKTLLAQVRRLRYERQQIGSKWDNPFAWVRHVCQADTFYYGKTRTQAIDQVELLRSLDCVDEKMSLE